jgi:hypothetical protein
MQNSSQFFSNSLIKGHNWNRGVIEKYVKNNIFEVCMYLCASNVINNSKKCSKNSEYVQLEGAFIICLLPRAHWKKFSWHSYILQDSFFESTVDECNGQFFRISCFGRMWLLQHTTCCCGSVRPPAARRLPPTQTRLTLFMGRRIFYHRLRDRCGGRLGGSKLNLLWVVGPGYCFGLTPAHISGPRLLPDYLQVAIVLHRLRA